MSSTVNAGIVFTGVGISAAIVIGVTVPSAAKNPCGPCGTAPVIEMSAAEAIVAYACIRGELVTGYAKSGDHYASSYQNNDTIQHHIDRQSVATAS